MKQNIYFNGKHWHCLSIFYNRKGWAKLLSFVREFYRSNIKNIDFIYYTFSTLNGDRLDVILSFKTSKLSKSHIEKFFNAFLQENPSEDIKDEEWQAKVIWMPYANNSIEWNKFHLPMKILTNSELKKSAMLQSVIGLLMSSFFQDIQSIPIFLNIQMLKHLIEQHIDIFPDYVDDESVRINISAIDSYFTFKPKDILLFNMLSQWQNNNLFQYKKNPLSHYLDVYVMIREQYCCYDEGNQILSSIVLKFYKAKLKNWSI